MTNRLRATLNTAQHYRAAARLAMRNKGYIYLLDRGLYAAYREIFGFPALKLKNGDRALAMCFMAAMVEAGDA